MKRTKIKRELAERPEEIKGFNKSEITVGPPEAMSKSKKML